MTFYDLLANREANTRTGILFSSMKTLENNENPLIVLWINSNAVILDGEEPIISSIFSRNMNPRWLLPAEFDGIVNQVLKELDKL
jgi:hypothetical protein